MAIGKLFIGRKIRELRDANRATQAQFAERIGISTSYLNQIENDQRPVSAAVLVAPAEKFQINMSELSSGEGDRLLSTITEALMDPLFENLSPSFQELKLITQSAPNLARAFIQAHQGYKRNNEQLVGLSDSLGRSASLAETTPYEEVRDSFILSIITYTRSILRRRNWQVNLVWETETITRPCPAFSNLSIR